MLTSIRRRAAVQLPLLSAILVVVMTGATLLGVCALLLTTSQERALDEGVARATAREVDVTAFTTGVAGKDARSVADDSRAVLAATFEPFPVSTSTRASSAMRALGRQTGSTHRWAYLSAVEGLGDRARLTAGHWPRAAAAGEPLEAVVLEPTLRALGLTPERALGHRVNLGEEIRPDQAGPQPVVIVGIFRPLPGAGWDRDPIAAAGYDPAFQDGRYPQPSRVYGPFVVDPAAFFAGGSTVNRLQVTAHPDLSAPTGAALQRVETALGPVDNRLARALGTRVKVARVDSALPSTLAAAHAQQGVTRSVVLVVVLLGLVLAAAALGLAGRLVAALRADETALFATLGAGRGQLAAMAATEALGLAVLGAAIAVPLSALAHSGLTHLPLLSDAGLTTGPQVTPAQIAAVVGGAVLLAAVLVVPSLRPDPAQVTAGSGRLALLTRSGGDVALVVLAATGWWQLLVQPEAGGGTDVVRVLAPTLFLLAGAALALRVVALPLRGAQWWAGRSRALVLPLAAFEAARRPQAAAAALLVALAVAAGTFGLAFGATWQQSQHEQADVRVGTDLSVALTSAPAAGEGEAVTRATGGTVSPAVDRGVAVGQWLGGPGDAPQLVAIEAARSGTLLRGRLPAGQTWAQVGAGLKPGSPVTGMPLPAGGDPGLTITGSTDSPIPVQVAPRLVIQDRTGLRTPCTADTVMMDGRSHPLTLCGTPSEGRQLVALALQLSAGPSFEMDYSNPSVDESRSRVTVTISGPPGPAKAAAWSVSGDPTGASDPPAQAFGLRTEVSSTERATRLRTTGQIVASSLGYYPADILATAFRPPAALPVAVSSRLFEALRAPVGTGLSVTVGSAEVPVVVSAVVPSVPSAPGAVALLSDIDQLSRILIARGEFTSPANAWWVGGPTRPAAATEALGLGEVVSRADETRQLTRGPLRVGLPAALVVLVPAALLLLLAGTVMHVTSDVETRALEVARLRGLGLSRRDILVTLLAQHGAVQALLLGAGAVIGGLAARAVGPLLIRSDLGATPVPAAVARWPWPAEGALLAVLLIGGTAVVALVIAVQVRRADSAHLRVSA